MFIWFRRIFPSHPKKISLIVTYNLIQNTKIIKYAWNHNFIAYQPLFFFPIQPNRNFMYVLLGRKKLGINYAIKRMIKWTNYIK